jgi:hypothetical protein
VRAYEHALNGLLGRLDAIESDGNEEVRDVRRGVVREVERALKEVERKVKEQIPQAPVPEVTKRGASDVESEDLGASATHASHHRSCQTDAAQRRSSGLPGRC